ncbi:MAG TPA: hypothetical protein VFD43_09080 [Planctomycetota bacterium]|nr:hypothetical protein [Planctomycetota bacterium]
MSPALPTISWTTEASTGDRVWTLRIPLVLTTDAAAVERIKTRVAAWALRVVAQALEDLDAPPVDAPPPP